MNSFDQVKSGEFKRTATDFHNVISSEPGSVFPPEAGRYVLYVSYACPWAHRCLILRALKGLENIIDVVSVNPEWNVVDETTGKCSWVFKDEVVDNVRTVDHLNNAKSLKDVYEIHDPAYTGRYTVPFLFDRVTRKIVNNESSEIIQILNNNFQSFATHSDFTMWPSTVDKALITAQNERMYNSFNNGVYRAGFAQSQTAHMEGVRDIWTYLDEIEEHLEKNRFVCGNNFSESDIRLFVTAVRFDDVYHTHFKCAKYRIDTHYPNITAWMSDVYHNVFNDAARETIKVNHIKDHYYKSHPLLNPFKLVPDTGVLVLYTRKSEDLAASRAALTALKKTN